MENLGSLPPPHLVVSRSVSNLGESWWQQMAPVIPKGWFIDPIDTLVFLTIRFRCSRHALINSWHRSPPVSKIQR